MSQPAGENNRAEGLSSKFFKGAIVLHRLLDVEAVPVATAPESGGDKRDQSIKTFAFATMPKIVVADIAIAGGGMGGVAAALSAGGSLKAVLTEETSWLGGQLSAQGVAALDENKYVETTGACRNYLEMREAIRQFYRDSGKLTESAASDPLLHPGTSWVTRLAFEPHVALAVLDKMLAPLVESGALTVLKRTKIVAVHLVGDDPARAEDRDASKIDALLAVNLDSGEFTEIQCSVAVDATELGDLMPLAKIPYQTGSDSRWFTNEPHAPETANAENVQDFTYPFILTFHPGENHTIDKPEDYDSFAEAGKFSFDDYKMFAETDDEKDGKKRHLLPFWTYRRLIDNSLFVKGAYQSDIAMINWDSNDLRGKNIIDKTPEVQRDYLALGKRVSLGFLYWLQTEAARDDGGKGYPELKLDLQLLGTKDGLSKYPYIREARRLAAITRVVEQDIVESENPGARAKLMSDSCGIGLYPVDIHGFQEVPGAAQQTRPFQVPTGALLGEYCPNYIAACKNIGVTHITNGAYRLHPIEWAIGTAAGALAKHAIANNLSPLHFVGKESNLLSLQISLAKDGAPVFWFDDVKPDDAHFAAAQVLAVSGIIHCDSDNLSFDGDEAVNWQAVSEAISANPTLFDCAADLQSALEKLKADYPEATRSQCALSLFNVLTARTGKVRAETEGLLS